MNDLAKKNKPQDHRRPAGAQRPDADVRARPVAKGYIGDVLDAQHERDLQQAVRARRRPHLAGRPQERRQHDDDCRWSQHRRRSATFWASSRGLGAGQTLIKEWKHAETGDMMKVDSPDCVSVGGRFRTGAEVSYQVGASPAQPERQSVRDLRQRRDAGISTALQHRARTCCTASKGKDPLVEMPAAGRSTSWRPKARRQARRAT